MEFLSRFFSGAVPRRWLAAFVAAVAVLLYINTAGNGFVLDDRSAITENPIVQKGVTSIPEIFGTPYLYGYAHVSNDLYRPLPLAMFAIEYQLGVGSPVAGHVVNIVLFGCCVWVLFLFLDLLMRRKQVFAAFVAALLFAFHPVHTEVVANIKSQDELLCFLFSFLSLLSFIHYASSGKWLQLVAGSCCYLLSLLSKETGISLVVIIPILFLVFLSFDRMRSMRIIVSSLIVATLYLTLRFSVLSAFHANNTFEFSVATNALAAAPTVSVRLATAVFMLGRYLKLLCIPYPLVCDYSYNEIPLVGFGNVAVWVSAGAYVVLLTASIYRLVRSRHDAIAFGIMFFLITLSLFANVFFMVGATMAERFLFFPSAGFCLVIAVLIARLSNAAHRNKVVPLLVVICSACALIILSRNREWADARTLYTADAKNAPGSFRLHYYLGSTLINDANKETDTAAKYKLIRHGIHSLERAQAIYPGFTILFKEIGNSYLKLSDYTSAEPFLQRAVDLEPSDTLAATDLAALYFKTARYRESLDICIDIVRHNPRYARAYRNMGSCYLKTGAYDSAIIVLKKSIDIEPAPAAYHNLSVAFELAGKADSSAKYRQLAR